MSGIASRAPPPSPSLPGRRWSALHLQEQVGPLTWGQVQLSRVLTVQPWPSRLTLFDSNTVSR